jgi:hypothetical protein
MSRFSWHNLLSQLPSHASYSRGGMAHVEPTAIVALARLMSSETRDLSALQSAWSWIVERQLANGSIAPNAKLTEPGWGTSWALILQHCWEVTGRTPQATLNRAAALDWLLTLKGHTFANQKVKHGGHDTNLAGWPWIEGTHSWLEPTCLAVLALRFIGQANHPRCVEGTQLLLDRLLPSGGANYGNTIVLGQELKPHLQPTGMVLAALAGTPDPIGLQAKAIDYLLRELGPETGAASLAWGLLGLAAQQRLPAQADAWLTTCVERVLRRDGSPYRLGLLCWAAQVVHDPEHRILPGFAVAMTGAAT